MKVAFASSDGEHIDQHFGWSKIFYLFEVGEDSFELLKEIDSAEEIENEKEKLNYKIKTIEDADIMYCTQIGPTASKMVQGAGIHPVRVTDGEKIVDAIAQLHEMIAKKEPIWLLRIFHKAKQRSA